MWWHRDFDDVRWKHRAGTIGMLANVVGGQSGVQRNLWLDTCLWCIRAINFRPGAAGMFVAAVLIR